MIGHNGGFLIFSGEMSYVGETNPLEKPELSSSIDIAKPPRAHR
jgi:hypothetical protein